MTGGESLFSCIKQQETREEAARCAPPPKAAPVPGPAPANAPAPQPPKRDEELYAKVSALEAKIKKSEEKNSVSAAAIESLKAEAQAARLRAAQLERDAAEFKKISEASSLSAGRVKEELAALRGRTASIEDIIRRLDASSLNSLVLSVGLFEGRLKSLEAGMASEIKERFAGLDTAFGDTARKAGLAQETAAGCARRVEKFEERTAGLPYLENRLGAMEGKLERLYELEALAQFLKLSVEGMEKSISAAMRESALISGEHKKTCADFESLYRQVRQLTALFNQFRTELAFLMPKQQETTDA